MTRIITRGICALALFIGCPPPPITPAPPREKTLCQGICATLVKFNCTSNASCVTCEQACINSQAIPEFARPLECLRVAKSVDEVRACGVDCP